MSDHDSDDTQSAETKPDTDAPQDTSEQSQQPSGGNVDLSEEGREEVHEMVEAYQDKPTVTLPGSDGTISGTAINEWLDDDGNPKYGDPAEHPFQNKDEASDSG